MPRGTKLHEFIADWEIALMVEEDEMSYPDICEYLENAYDVSFHPETIGLHYREWRNQNPKECFHCGEVFYYRDNECNYFCSSECKKLYQKEMKKQQDKLMKEIKNELHKPWYIKAWERLANTLSWS